jgi:glutamate-5-semialdehyde dehydrogenase
MSAIEPLNELSAGMAIVFGGNRITRVSAELAAAFRPGDSVVVVQATGELLLVPRAERELAEAAVGRAQGAFQTLNATSDATIARFFAAFAARLADATVWGGIQAANLRDVASAEARGRSTTRLVADDRMRANMIAGLRGWIDAPSRRGQVLETVERDGWRVELVGAALGPVAFVFEGRPNVLADATGVLRAGNPVVFRIGSDALGTARAMMRLALTPALGDAGLPDGAVTLIDSPSHAAGWALFSSPGLALAVARGSGAAVSQLGALAEQAGTPVSLHGTGGAWVIAAEDASADELEAVVTISLDRKVCNTLNTCCIPRARADDLVPAVLAGLDAAGARLGQGYKLHVEAEDREAVPAVLFTRRVRVHRPAGEVDEPQAELLEPGDLGREWEWEQTPEITLKLIDDVDHAVALFNRHSPRFVASLIGGDAAAQDRFFRAIEAPFVGDGHTRWVDGQVALAKPELGLSNWERGRLFGRGGILCGDGVYTVRTRARMRG